MNNTIFDQIWSLFHPKPTVVNAPVTIADLSNQIIVATNTDYIDVTPKLLMSISSTIPLQRATDIADSINAHSRNYNITKDMLTMYLTQTMEESQFYTVLEENLFYTTPERIKAVWPTRFATVNSAVPYLKNPQKLANFVYANRMGNTGPNDGFLYKGRGAIMATGKNNYNELQAAFNVDYARLCEYLVEPEGAVESAFYYWQKHNLGRFTTRDQIAACTMAINGGLINLHDRQAIFDTVSH